MYRLVLKKKNEKIQKFNLKNIKLFAENLPNFYLSKRWDFLFELNFALSSLEWKKS